MLSITDYLSPSPQLYINGKTRYQNNLGGFFTSGLAILSLIAFSHFASRITQRLEPKVTFNQIYKSNGTALKINTSEPNGYEFYLVNGDTSQTYDDPETYFEINAWMTTWGFENGQETVLDGKQINFTRCANSTVSNAFCFAPGQILKLENAFIQFPYTLFYISVRQCNNNTRTDCKTQDEIREKLKYSFFKIKVPTFFVNSDNYEMPLIPFIKTTEAIVTTQLTRRGYYFFKEVNYNSDDGFVLENRTDYSEVVLRTFTDSTSIIRLLSDWDGNDIYFETFWAFDSDGIQDTYKREYKKIQNVLAEIGGFINGLRMVGILFVYIYFEYAYFLEIFDPFFIFSNTHSKNSNVYIHAPITIPQTSQLNFSESIIRPPEAQRTKVQVMMPTALRAMLNVVFKCRANNTFSKAARVFRAKYSDVRNLVYLRNEVEILKYVCINTANGEKVYDHMKRMINIDDVETSKSFFMSSARVQEKQKDVMAILNNPCNDSTLKRLVDYFTNKI
jgi:hypothetical protein